jgi:glutathione S-transferase
VILLYHFGHPFGFDPSPFCLKLEAYLRLAGLPYEARRGSVRAAPKRKLPYIEDDGRVVADSGAIIDYLKQRYGDPLDGGLDAASRAEAHAWRRTLEESLYWILVYFRWIDDAGWQVVRRRFFATLPAPLRVVAPPLIRRSVRRTLWGQGTLRHGRDEILALGSADLAHLAAFLGDKPFLQGAAPTSLDATAYGFLANLYYPPDPTPLTEALRGHANLVAYTARMRERVGQPPAA